MKRKGSDQAAQPKKKPNKKKKTQGSIDKQEKKKTILELKNGNPDLTFKDIEDITGISKTTAHRWYQNPNEVVGKSGPPCLFDTEEEKVLKMWIFEMQESGYNVNKDLK